MSSDDVQAGLTTEHLLMIEQAAGRLRTEFDGVFNVETIERYLIDSRERLALRATITNWMPLLVEKFTRERLRAHARLEFGALGRPAVLFLCVHNAGRSQMAAGWLRHLAGEAVEVFSGGSDPDIGTNANAVAAMAEVGIDIAAEFPKPWTDEIARAADVIVTMGCGDACPVLPGKRYEDWELTDPSEQPIDVVRDIRDDIRVRVEHLLAGLEPASA